MRLKEFLYSKMCVFLIFFLKFSGILKCRMVWHECDIYRLPYTRFRLIINILNLKMARKWKKMTNCCNSISITFSSTCPCPSNQSTQFLHVAQPTSIVFIVNLELLAACFVGVLIQLFTARC